MAPIASTVATYRKLPPGVNRIYPSDTPAMDESKFLNGTAAVIDAPNGA